MPLTSSIRAVKKIIGVTLLLAIAIVGWKGISLWSLSKAIDARLAQITNQHVGLVESRVTAIAPLQGSLLAPELSPALQQVASAVQKEKSEPTVEAILETQGSVTEFLNSVPGDSEASADPAVYVSKETLGKGSELDQQFQAYNTMVQQWNNEQDTWLGQQFFSLFDLKPRLLLNTDGRKEFETTVTF